MPSCPCPDTLRLLGSGSPGDASHSPLDEHINGCPACQEILERLVREPGETTDTGAGRMPGPDLLPRIPDLEIERELGRGGMGVVYQAWDPRLSRHVALKVVVSGPTAGTRERERWLREARAVTRVQHPHVVQLHQVGEAGGWLYLVLEFVAGGSLAARLQGPLPPRDAVELLRPVASAVIAIHKAGLLHLDLKPSNILLDSAPGTRWRDAFPRLADFGIARPLAQLDRTSITAAGPWGTPSYMAPEQATADRKAIGPATDVYALGAILYELLTGRPPFQGASTLETLDQVRTQEPVPPRRFNPKLPRDLETIVLKCLEKSPSRRYTSAEAMADELQRWLDGRPIKARRVSVFGHVGRWCQRRPDVALLIGILTLTVSAGFLSTLLLWRRAEAARRRAEADFQTTNEVLSQIVEQSVPVNHLRVVNPDRLIPALRETRRRLLAVAERRPGHPGISLQLATVDPALGNLLVQERRSLVEARSLFDEALRCLDIVLREQPRDPRALSYRIGVLASSARLAEKQERPEESLGYFRQAVDAGEALVRNYPTAESICELASTRNSLVEYLVHRGDLEGARRVLSANRLLLGNVPVDAENSRVAAWRAFVQVSSNRLGVRSAPTPTAAGWDGGMGVPDPLARLASPAANHLSAQNWAELAAEALQSATRAGHDPADVAEAGYQFLVPLGGTAAQQRHSGELDDARRTADRILALGRLLVARHPDQPAAHLALSEGYTQVYKNAWQTDDLAAVEQNMRLALDATLHAQTLDPNSEVARFLAERRQRGLKGLVDGRAASK